MIRKLTWSGIVVMAGIALAACAPAVQPIDGMMKETPALASTGKPAEMMANTPDDTMMQSTVDPSMMEKTPEATSGKMDPAWFTVDLTNAATGDTFVVADFKGKVVLVETMAQWCTNCKQQQGEIKRLHAILAGRDDLITLGIDIDPKEDLPTLKTYIERNGFDWNYTVAPVDVSNELAKLYGDQFLNPTSTPMLIIDRKGGVHPLPFGIKTAEDLQKALEPFLSAGM